MGRMRGEHLVRNSELLKMNCAFGGDEFAAELRARELFLFGEQHTRTARGQMNCGATSGRPAARDDYIVIAHIGLEFRL